MKMMISIDNAAAAEQNLITNFLASRNWGYWHYIEDLWLLQAVPAGFTPKRVFDDLIESNPSLATKNIVVMTIEAAPTYWGRAPKEAWDWMKQNWGMPG